MQVALGKSGGPADESQNNAVEHIPSHRAPSSKANGMGMTEAKQSLLSMDDLTLSATDGTALKQPRTTQPGTTTNQGGLG